MKHLPFRCGTVDAYLVIGLVDASEEVKQRLLDIVNAPIEPEVKPA
jgi:hypothetical protein